MIKRVHILFICLLLGNGIFAQSGDFIVAYEYWVDDDYAGSSQVDIPPQQDYELSSSLNVGPLENGIHVFSIRFMDDLGRWSSVMRKYFTVFPELDNPNHVVEAEFWFDNDYSAALNYPVNVGQTFEIQDQIDASSLPPGFHTISWWFKDSSGNHSPPMTKTFVGKGNGSDEGYITSYRVWFNDDLGNLQEINTNSTANPYELIEDLATNNIPEGEMQKVCFQFQNDLGLWSGVYCSFFDKDLACIGDLNGDEIIDVDDLLIYLSVFGCLGDCGLADMNFDGIVNVVDLVVFLGVYGTTCE